MRKATRSNVGGGLIHYLLLTIGYWQTVRRGTARRLEDAVMGRWVVVIAVVLIAGLVGSGNALALSGSGTEEDPWRI